MYYPPSIISTVCTHTPLTEGPSRCAPISKISWLNTDANPLILFSGGLPADDDDDHHTVTVVYGTDHIALDFTSPVVDYITVIGGCG